MDRDLIKTTALGQDFQMAVHRSDEIVSSMIRKNNFYSVRDLLLIERFLRPGRTFIDAGANIGWYSIVASKITGPQGKVIAFEPEPNNRALLAANIELNSATNIEISDFALSDECSVNTLFLSTENSGDHSLSVNGPKTTERHGVEVRTTTLAAYMSEEEFAKVDFIKIDIQGSEPRMLAGMEKLIRSHRPVFMLEYAPAHINECKSSPFEIFAFLDTQQYYPFRIHDADYSDLNRDLLSSVSIDNLFDYTRDMLTEGRCGRSIDLLLVPFESAKDLINEGLSFPLRHPIKPL